MTKRLSYDSIERFRRVNEHFPRIDDPTLIILKGHLLAEEILDHILQFSCKNPEVLNNVDINFFLKRRLVEALVGKSSVKGINYPVKVWEALDALNALRNELAHSLESQKINAKIQRFLATSHPERVQTFEPDTLPELLSTATMNFLGYLSCFECMVLTGEIPPEIDHA